MITIVFESHATTFDNENQLASGLFDAELSPTGIGEAKQLGRKYADDHFDVIFCSDRKRSFMTAEIAYGNKYPIIKDERLRECDFGKLEHKKKADTREDRIKQRLKYISEPYPGGESYEQRATLIKNFLKDLLSNYPEKRVLIIGHGATLFGLEHWITGKSLREVIGNTIIKQRSKTYTLSRI